MKKIMFAAAVAAAGLAFGVESANTVGYNTKALEAGKFSILGVQFEGTDASTDINKIISGVTGVDFDEQFVFRSTAPHIQVPNSKGTYDLYYYLSDGWYDNGTEEGATKPGWCDQNGTIAGEVGSDADGALIPGVAVWVKDALNAVTIQQAGQVPTEDVTVTAPAVFALRAHACPVTFNLNDTSKVTFSGLTGVDFDDQFAFRSTAPHIQVPNSKGTYDLYYYLNDGWYDDGTEEGGTKPGWCDQNGTIAGEVGSDADGNVPTGFGFWTKGVSNSFTITFKK